jgi:hypothetical protein
MSAVEQQELTDVEHLARAVERSHLLSELSRTVEQGICALPSNNRLGDWPEERIVGWVIQVEHAYDHLKAAMEFLT